MDASTMNFAKIPGAMSAPFGTTEQDSLLNLLPDAQAYGSTTLDGGFPDSLLDLVDWDASLENCAPIDWDWNQDGQ
jgi:hypothetical protein